MIAGRVFFENLRGIFRYLNALRFVRPRCFSSPINSVRRNVPATIKSNGRTFDIVHYSRNARLSTITEFDLRNVPRERLRSEMYERRFPTLAYRSRRLQFVFAVAGFAGSTDFIFRSIIYFVRANVGRMILPYSGRYETVAIVGVHRNTRVLFYAYPTFYRKYVHK